MQTLKFSQALEVNTGLCAAACRVSQLPVLLLENEVLGAHQQHLCGGGAGPWVSLLAEPVHACFPHLLG